MGKRAPFLIAAVVALLLIGGAVAAYVYDSGRDDLIAKGVTVAGVDVGGMRSDAATRLLQQRLAARIERPIVVRANHRRFRMSARKAGVSTDVGGMVAEAVQASRSGNTFSRAWRDLTGGEVNKHVDLRMNYSKDAVTELVARVKKTVNRKPQDASIKPSASGLQRVPSHTGVGLQADDLQHRIEAAISNPEARHLVQARMRIVQPKVSTEELADANPWYIVINRPAFKLTVYDRLRVKKTYTVAVGQVGLETPAGLYHVQNKAINPAWHVPNSAWAGDLAGKVISGDDPTNPIKARWLGIFDGAGIHGTDEVSSLGHAASHGCIRMAIPDVIEVYDEVPVGAPVYIA
jgi:L,D-transpeptidase catalytic domain/Putative peptidoglycan binding domain